MTAAPLLAGSVGLFRFRHHWTVGEASRGDLAIPSSTGVGGERPVERCDGGKDSRAMMVRAIRGARVIELLVSIRPGEQSAFRRLA
jgi:hypothetical protein